ncbi:pre-mycofactocin synthase MftD [Mycolicibacterium sp. P9-22]|uniref:pre-mycofactocin synthase MftD n=1 Tax=Mycolicibacterium sp. P9-22 TaxID=2024613 RepID=UPI0011EFEA7E|nr:pre-mycofactocin synthase MftD [Mycolicibacterium sp. P9-22]KAA0120928.1 mycofactocin system-associated heme/flavin dehydrogenase [Mycolicibacterium sp. P9-22]
MTLNLWKRDSWFETVAVAQDRARKRLPQPVYSSRVAGAERGQTALNNPNAFAELGFAPIVAGAKSERRTIRTVLGQHVALPVLISPAGMQAMHPDGEVAVARAAASRGTIMGLSNFAAKPVEEVVAASPNTFFQMYWTGGRDTMLERMQRAHAAGVQGIIATTDWSFSRGRDSGSPQIPDRLDLGAILRFAPQIIHKRRWWWEFAKRLQLPDLSAPNFVSLGESPPSFSEAYRQFLATPPPQWDDIAWLVDTWGQMSGKPFMLKGVCRVDDARRAVDAGVDAISVSNHGGNNLDGTPATIRLVHAIASEVGQQITVVLDGGVRRGSDVVKALALGAKAVMIGRAYLWGFGANGQAGVENVLDVLRDGVDSTLMGLGVSSIDELGPHHLIVPEGFHLRIDEHAA